MIATAIVFATTFASSATLDSQAGEAEGERVALWPEGKVPGLEEHQYGTLLAALSSQTRTYEPVDEVDALPCNVNWAAPAYPAYVLTDKGEIAPGFKFDSGTCPLFLMHGDSDGFSPMASVKVYTKLHAVRQSRKGRGRK